MSIYERLYDKYLWKKDPSGTLYYKNKGVNIGEHCSFIGDSIGFSSEPYLIHIKDHVRISFGVNFITHDGGTYVLRKSEPDLCIYGSIVVNENTSIGAKSIIMPNIIIGKNVIVGAGSVVTKNIPNNQVWAGVPAKFICTIEEYKEKNKDKFSYILNESYNKKKEILLKTLEGIL